MNRIRMHARRRRTLVLAGALCLAVAAWPTSAFGNGEIDVAATTTSGINILESEASSETCTSPQLVQAFATLGDLRDYVLAPGGSFEDDDLEGWQVRKAGISEEGSPLTVQTAYQDDDDDNQHSLRVPAGGSALSPAMCVDLNYPIFRFMAKAVSGTGQLRVEVVYPDAADPSFHSAASLPAPAGRGWDATGDVELFPERGGVAPGMRRVALRFTSVAVNGTAGTWKIDDVYVDPRRL